MSEPGLAVEDLALRLGSFALRGIGFAVAPGETLVLLGPNGAGKSVCLEAVAGFHALQSGRIVIGGRDVTRAPPEARRIGFLFQSFGLFPHCTVAENVALGARARPGTGEVDALLRRFDIAHLATRRPAALSPGERQRCALARALMSRPAVFLFDEPFSALDAATRESLCEDLAAFLKRAGVAALFVTHDHAEALALGDRLAVIDGGEILQQGPARTVFARPATPRAARLLGVENLLPGRVVGAAGGMIQVEIGAGRTLDADGADAAVVAGAVMVCVRAGEVRILAAPVPTIGAANRLAGRIVAVRDLGAVSKATIDCGIPLVAHLLTRDARALSLVPGHPVVIEIAADAVHVVPRPEA